MSRSSQGAQVRHVLTKDYAILAATHTFIRSGMNMPLLQATDRHITLAGIHVPPH